MTMATQSRGSYGPDLYIPPRNSASPLGRPKKATRTSADNLEFGEMDRFALHLQDAELAHVEVDRDRLKFEGQQIEFEASEREQERAERRRKLESPQKLELKKFNLMIEAFSRK